MCEILERYKRKYIKNIKKESLKINGDKEVIFGKNLTLYEVFDRATQRDALRATLNVPLERIFVKLKPEIPSLPILENRTDLLNCIKLLCDIMVAESDGDCQKVGDYVWWPQDVPN